MLCVYKMIQNVLCTYASGRFLPTPCRLKAPRAASAITQLTDGRSRQFRVESPSWPLSRWGIPTTWSWPGTGPKTSRRNLRGKPVIFLEKKCVFPLTLIESSGVSEGSTKSCFSVDISCDFCKEHRYIFIYYMFCCLKWSICRKFVWYCFCWILDIGVRILYLCNNVTYVHLFTFWRTQLNHHQHPTQHWGISAASGFWRFDSTVYSVE